jgi:hypothetical protein
MLSLHPETREASHPRAATEPSDLRGGHGAEASPEKGDAALGSRAVGLRSPSAKRFPVWGAALFRLVTLGAMEIAHGKEKGTY